MPVPLPHNGGIVVGIGVSFGSGARPDTASAELPGFSSRRSIVATATFMLAAFATVYVARHILNSVMGRVMAGLIGIKSSAWVSPSPVCPAQPRFLNFFDIMRRPGYRAFWRWLARW